MFNFKGSFNVVPSLPKELEPLREIAFNIFWSWNQDALKLFRRIDSKIWADSNHNPVVLLGKVSQERLQELADDHGFVAHMNRVYEGLNEYLNDLTWYQKNYSKSDKPFVAKRERNEDKCEIIQN